MDVFRWIGNDDDDDDRHIKTSAIPREVTSQMRSRAVRQYWKFPLPDCAGIVRGDGK